MLTEKPQPSDSPQNSKLVDIVTRQQADLQDVTILWH